MNRDKSFFRYMLLHYFDVKKTVTETHHLLSKMYGDETRKEHVEFGLNTFETVILTWETKNVPDSRKKFKMSSCNNCIQMKPLQLTSYQ